MWFCPHTHDERVWEECWRVIATIQGLRYLCVTIETCSYKLETKSGRLLEPLRAVRGLQVFEVDAPWLEYAADYRDVPFVFIPEGRSST